MFLWLDDPTRIKNSMGLTRGKNDSIDAARIAEYARRYEDKTVRYEHPERHQGQTCAQDVLCHQA